MSHALAVQSTDASSVVASLAAADSESWLSRLFFHRWDGALLQRNNFENFLYGFGVALALITAGLIVVEQVLRRVGFKVSRQTAAKFCMALTALGFLSYFGFFNPNTRYVNYYHRHEFFHYYLGSKYSEELGYSRIYECTAIAEIELGHRADIAKQELRDLGAKNLIRPIKDTYVFKDPAQCTDHFTADRWLAFKNDVKWFRSSARGDYWNNMKKDHGYNPPPVWTVVGKAFTQLGPASDALFKWLAGIDVMFHIGILVLLRWAFGWRVTALASVFWGTNTAANFYWTGGAFLRHDWAFLFVASVCLAKKKHFALAGAAFIWAGLIRVFPLGAGFGWAVMIATYWLRHRKLHPSHKRFIGGVAIALAIIIPTTLSVTGVDAYKEFASHISLHKNTPLTNHMGLETMLVHSWDGRMRFTRDDSYDDAFEPWKQGRAERKAAWTPAVVLWWGALMAWIAWALHRSNHFWLGLPLSVPLVMSMTNLTCYYYVIFVPLAALARLRPAVGVALVLTAAGSQVLLKHFYWIDDRYAALSYLYFTMGLCAIYAFSRPLNRASVTKWLRSLRGPDRARSR